MRLYRAPEMEPVDCDDERKRSALGHSVPCHLVAPGSLAHLLVRDGRLVPSRLTFQIIDFGQGSWDRYQGQKLSTGRSWRSWQEFVPPG